MSHMIRFLSDMRVNPKMQEMFWQSPTLALGSVDLPETGLSKLSNQNNVTITTDMVDELAVHELTTVVGGAFLTEPGPDTWPDPPPPPEPPKPPRPLPRLSDKKW